MEKLRVGEVVIVEGRYDATALAGLIDGLILTTNGFSIFKDEEKKALIQRLGAQRGLLILTDSDAAGFKIRHYIEKIAAGCEIKNAYIPALPGKEGRKAAPSKEGTLGVEGMPPQTLAAALRRAGVAATPAPAGGAISYTDLYELGISGGAGSAERRRALLQKLGLPPRLSKKALSQVLSSLYTKQELEAMLNGQDLQNVPKRQNAQASPKNTSEKPVLFWDFHATLTLPDVTWFDAALEAAAEIGVARPLTLEDLKTHFWGTCLPWYSIPSRDTRHLTAPGKWWAHCEGEFVTMFQKCGLSRAEAEKLAPLLREKVLQPQRYQLYPDALDTLKTLKQRGYRSYILSNNFPELEEIVNAIGLAPYFEGVLVSAKIGYDKPRKEIFEAALAAANHPQNAWMIGDNPEDDIAGGAAAGFTTVAVHGAAAPQATHQINALGELVGLLP